MSTPHNTLGLTIERSVGDFAASDAWHRDDAKDEAVTHIPHRRPAGVGPLNLRKP